jgi:uncharacterized protein YozE (UPF0346 family)
MFLIPKQYSWMLYAYLMRYLQPKEFEKKNHIVDTTRQDKAEQVHCSWY